MIKNKIQKGINTIFLISYSLMILAYARDNGPLDQSEINAGKVIVDMLLMIILNWAAWRLLTKINRSISIFLKKEEVEKFKIV